MANTKNTSPIKPTDPAACGAAMGVTSLKSPARNLRYCTRPASTCPYHQRR